MKKLKKLFAVMLSLVMVLAMGITSFAATAGTDGKYGTADDLGNITVTGVLKEGQVAVTAYKVIEAQYNNNSGSFSGYNSLYPNVIANTDIQGGLTELSSDKLNALANAVIADTNKDPIEMDLVKGTTNTWTKAVQPGTYLVLVTNSETKSYNPMVVSVYYTNVDGSTNGLNQGNLVIQEGGATAKVSGQPKIDKVITSGNGTNKGNSAGFTSATEGDTVSYKVSVKPIPNYNGSYPVFNVVDTLDKGLKFVANDVTVKVLGGGENGADVTLTKDTDYTFNPSKNNDKTVLTVNFVVNGNYTLNNYAGKEVVITYNATLTSDATLNNNANVNDVVLNYTRDSKTTDNNDSDEDKTFTYTFDIGSSATGTTGIINKKGDKTDDINGLNGATFALYKGSQLKQDGTFDGQPYKTTDSETQGLTKGQLHFTGLAAGTYYLQETKAPDGYSVNTTIFKVVIEATYYEAADEGIEVGMLKTWNVKVAEGINGELKNVASFTVNNNGQTSNISGMDIKNTSISALPSTGGIGTTIFTIVGCGIMIAAAGLFFASRRKENR